MARKIIWTHLAKHERKSLLEYWANRNGSKTYSKKLYRKINAYISLIASYPFIGRTTQVENVRFKIMDNYSIIYEVSEKVIYILSVWDDRQDPDKLVVQKR